MAVVGEAEVVIRAITTGIRRDIRRGFRGADQEGYRAGVSAGRSFQRGFRMAGGGGGGGGGGLGAILGGNFLASADAASQQFTALARTGFVLQPLFSGLAGAVGALGSALVSLVGILGAAAPGAMALGGSLSALAQAAITVKIAFGGVMNAIKASNKASKAAGKNNKAIADAQLRLERAREKAAILTLEIAARRKKAIAAEKEAQLDLNDAIREANEAYQQTKFSAEEAALGEQEAALALAKARDKLSATADLPAGSRARQEALLEFQQAELKYRQAKDRNNDAREASAKAADVQDREIRKATERYQETKNQLDPNSIGSQAYNDAKALAAANQDILDAERALKQAKKGNAAASNAEADAMKDLSAEAKSFVKFIQSLKKDYNELRAAAGKELFPKLEVAIGNLVKNLFPALKPLLKETGGIIGQIAINLSKTITKSDNLKLLKDVWKSNNINIKNFGDSTSSLYEVLLNLLKAATPLTERFTKWIKTLTAGWAETVKAKEKTGDLTKTFNIAGNILSQIGKIFGNVFGAFGQIIKANVGKGSGGQMLLDYFQEASARFKALLTAGNQDGSLRKFFADAAKNAIEIFKLFGKIGKAFAKIGASEGTGKFIKSLGKVIDILGEIGLDMAENGAVETFGDFLVEAATAAKNFSDAGGVQTFFKVLKNALMGINKALENPTVKKLFTTLGRWFAFASALGLIGTALAFIARVAIMKMIVVPLVALAKVLRFFIVGGALAKIRLFFTLLAAYAGLPLAPFLIIAGVIVALAATFVMIWKKSKIFRDAIKDLVKAVGTSLKKAFDTIQKALEEVKPVISGVGDTFKKVGDFLGKYIVPIFKFGLTVAIEVLGEAIAAVIKILAGLWEILTGNPLEGIKRIWNAIKDYLVNIAVIVITKFKELISEIFGPEAWEKLKTFFKNLPENILNFLIAAGKKIFEWFKSLGSFILNLIQNWPSILGKFWSWIFDLLVNVGSKIWNWFTNDLGPFLWELIKKLPVLYVKFWSWIFDLLVNVGSAIRNWFTNTLIPLIAGIPSKLLEAGKNFFSWIGVKLSSVLSTARGYFNTFIDWLKDIPGRIATNIAGMWDGLKNSFKDAINFIIKKWNDLKFELRLPNSIFGISLGSLAGKGFTLNTPDIKPLAKGGVVSPTPGGTLATIAEAGRPERVEPLDPDGLSKRDKAMIKMLAPQAGGVVINVYPSPGMDERELAAKVSRQLALQLRTGIA